MRKIQFKSELEKRAERLEEEAQRLKEENEELKAENDLLNIQTQAQADRTQFIEDVVAELAINVFSLQGGGSNANS